MLSYFVTSLVVYMLTTQSLTEKKIQVIDRAFPKDQAKGNYLYFVCNVGTEK